MFTHTELVHEMSGLKKFAMKLTKQESDADDLMQSTVLKALEKSDMFQSDTNLFKWTSKIMYNLFVSEYRRRAKFGTQYDPENYIEKHSMKETQDIEMEFREVQIAMENLSREHYQILVLICVKGLQYAEVSELLQIPVGTVRSRLFRARESLHALLAFPKKTTPPFSSGSPLEAIPESMLLAA